MDIDAIRNGIALAKAHERRHRRLETLLAAQAGALHSAIRLPSTAPEAELLRFATSYIERVPEFLDAAAAVARAARVEDYTVPLLQLAADFFLSPPQIVQQGAGLEELLDEAYLAHRLLEEVNDRFTARAGIPLLPVDTALSNLIVHHLIGEPFANELDDAVHYSLNRHSTREQVYDRPAFRAFAAVRHHDSWRRERQRWPELLDEHAITVRFF